MIHPLVTRLRFTRSEWQRALASISDEDARRRLQPMNSISWIIGHMAWHEQSYWLWLAQGKILVPELDSLVGSGRPASTPPLDQVWDAWQTVTSATDPYLDTLTPELLQTHMQVKGKQRSESIGTMLLRVTFHYWFHIGEVLSVRQLLGHMDLPEFVGDIGTHAPYRPE